MDVHPYSAALSDGNFKQRADQSRMRASATTFETQFLAEMLRLSGVAKPPNGFGGGFGEEAFAGFLADEYAKALARRCGVGLADHVFHALATRDGTE